MEKFFSVENGLGREMYTWMVDLFPFHRSLTGEGVRKTLGYIKKIIPSLSIHDVPTGTKAFDWEVPDEWNIRDAYVLDSEGNKVIDYRKSNLHVVSYSEPVNKTIDLDELNNHLHSLPEMPNAIPYVTSYYHKTWGFCISHNERQKLVQDDYHVVIDSDLKPGVLNFGELYIKGRTKEEILLSTYICHPSLANNELSGPVVTTALARWLQMVNDLKYSYRVLYLPERIGSIIYISKNIDFLKKYTKAGFQITCIGDDRSYSYLPSRQGDTISDRVACHVLKHLTSNFKKYSFLDAGSDEQQYCSPGVDLPVASIMRSKYGEYPEYHTSLDDLSLVSSKGLKGGFRALKYAIGCLESNDLPIPSQLCQPQLGKRNLYPSISSNKANLDARHAINYFSYVDGSNTLLDIAEIINVPFWELYKIHDKFVKAGVVQKL